MFENRRVARRYAKAFYNDRADKEKIAVLADELKVFAAAMERDVTIRDYFLSPMTTRKQKIAVVKDMCKELGFSSYLQSLLELLVQKHRMEILPEVAEELVVISDALNDRIRVNVTTAVEPSPDELDEMASHISKYFGRKAVIERHIDKSIIGGFRIESDDRMIDLSVRGQIDRLLSRF